LAIRLDRDRLALSIGEVADLDSDRTCAVEGGIQSSIGIEPVNTEVAVEVGPGRDDLAIRRLNRRGAAQWPRDAEIVELFCGRGNGLVALQRLGFTHLEGVDFSPRLIAQYKGSANCIVADCRTLPFGDSSKDMLIVQGGLHHLPNLPADLDQTFTEMQRVLRKDGFVVFVEPWRTPFLEFVRVVSELPMIRWLSGKMDAFATMVEHELPTYKQWLGQPELITRVAHSHFVPVHESFAWGKWNFVGMPR